MSNSIGRETAGNGRSSRTQPHEPSRKGLTSLEDRQRCVAYALKKLGDRSVLNRSPLTRMTYIERLAVERYSGHLLPRGLALRDTLIECIPESVKV